MWLVNMYIWFSVIFLSLRSRKVSTAVNGNSNSKPQSRTTCECIELRIDFESSNYFILNCESFWITNQFWIELWSTESESLVVTQHWSSDVQPWCTSSIVDESINLSMVILASISKNLPLFFSFSQQNSMVTCKCKWWGHCFSYYIWISNLEQAKSLKMKCQTAPQFSF